jgi:hypothetical protein
MLYVCMYVCVYIHIYIYIRQIMKRLTTQFPAAFPFLTSSFIGSSAPRSQTPSICETFCKGRGAPENLNTLHAMPRINKIINKLNAYDFTFQF